MRQIKQVKSHLTQSEWDALQRVRKQYGFKSDYEFVRASVLFAIKALGNDGVAELRGLPEELRERFADLINAYMLPTEIELDSGGDLFSRGYSGECPPPRAWVDRFVAIYYDRLYYEFSERVQISRERDGMTPSDILQDMMLWLYAKKTSHATYEAWEAWALARFKCPEAISEARGRAEIE